MRIGTALGTFLVAAALLPAGSFAEPPETSGSGKPPDPDELVTQTFVAHNRERAEAKLGPLALDPKLTAAARAHAKDMAAHGKMTHDGSDGSSPAARVKREGYHYQNTGENVAEGYRDVEGLMRGWMQSPHHRENILGKYTQVGIALDRDESGTPYWCADFGTPWEQLDPSRAARDLTSALNKERAAAGLRALVVRPKLAEAATRIVKEYSDADTLKLKERKTELVAILERLGYPYRRVAESAASGQPGVPEVVKTWMGSPDLREQILGDFTEIGVGYANSRTGKPYWGLVLARPRGR